jgi:hypothetical protein
VGRKGDTNPNTGELVAGPETLSEEELARNRADLATEILTHSLGGDWYRGRSGDLSKITVPLLSNGN